VKSRELRDSAWSPEVALRETVYHGAVWDVVRERFSYPGGVLVRDFVEHPGASAAVALDDQQRVVLLRQYRHPVRSYNWEIPAGLLDQPGEDPEECARRELAEEANLQASQWEFLVTLNVSPGGSNEVIHIFLAQGLSEVEHDFEKTGEEADIEVVRWPLDEAVSAACDGRIANHIAVTGLLLADARLRR
jgi:8-oxo-dGTP pyrophosphatase MutT (NUDIX family)